MLSGTALQAAARRAGTGDTRAGARGTEGVQNGDAFDPAVHGFGFPNWTGETGCEVSASECPDGSQFTLEYDPATLERVREGIDENWAVEVPSATAELLARIIHAAVERQTTTSGHCYGIVLAAEEYHGEPSSLPAGAASASEIPRPTGRYERVGERIRSYQESQLVDSEGFWLALVALQLGRVDTAAALAETVTAVDESGTANLAFGELGGGHQALAYHYERRGGEVHIHMYDPDEGADAYADAGDEPPTELVVDGESGEIVTSPFDYGNWTYADPDPDEDLLDRLTGGAEELLAEFDSGALFRAQSPIALAVDAPAEATVVRARPAADVGLGDAVLVLGASADEYELDVGGDGSAEYVLEAFGVRDGDVVIEEEVTGRIEGATDRFWVSVADGGTVRRVREGVSERARSNEDWLPLVGGGVAAALGVGGAYKYFSGSSRADDG